MRPMITLALSIEVLFKVCFLAIARQLLCIYNYRTLCHCDYTLWNWVCVLLSNPLQRLLTLFILKEHEKLYYKKIILEMILVI